MSESQHYDVVIVGSGFGGSVTALRLTEKGYRVAVLEAGRRFADGDFAKNSWHLRDFLWAPRLGCYGIQRIHALRNTLVLAGAGVGGGSLNYANTLYEPLPAFYRDPQWAHITDWRDELAPYYDQAKRMLGVVTNPSVTPSDEVMRAVAGDMGVAETYHPTPVGVFFGRPGEVSEDPFFGGAGPARTGCTECGECMTGCRHGAKNTLVKNYLYLAEQAGAQVFPLTTVVSIAPSGSGYAVDAVATDRRRHTRRFTADQVVLAAGTYNTQRLLHRMRDTGALPHVSARLGELTRTNSESIVGAATFRQRQDFSRGVAITSSFHPDEHTHIEPVRYGRGSNVMGLLQTVQTSGGGRLPRWVRWLAAAGRQLVRRPWWLARLMVVRGWSQRTIIILVMQSRDNSLTTYTRRTVLGRRRLTSRQGHGEPNPTWVPAGNQATRLAAERIGGQPGGNWGEVFGMPMTAHFLGGAPIGDSAQTGVVDAYHRVFGHPGLYVVDGAAVTANLGVNPSLTITAQAERAAAFWPNRGDADPRPPLGAPYQRLAPIPPAHPVVPAAAPGALRLPIVRVTS
jgi:cholesterol oxidase